MANTETVERTDAQASWSRASGANINPSGGGLVDRSDARRPFPDNSNSSVPAEERTSIRPDAQAAASHQTSPGSEHSFICNICLVSPDQPVVTVCGHMYCWGCLYKWLCMHRDQPQCPVCKAGIELVGGEPSKAKVVPLYVNGRTTDPRETTPEEIPQRPPGERPESHRRFIFPGWQGGLGPGAVHHGFGNVTLSAGFGLFPSLFGITFSQGPVGMAGRSDGGNLATPGRRGELNAEEEAQQEFLSRILFMVGIFIVLCLIFFP